jgi:hypothetical protein
MAVEPKHVLEARAQVARLYNNGKTPTQSEEHAVRARYVEIKIDSDIRKIVQKSLGGARLSDTGTAHLCGLLLSLAGVKYMKAEQIETLIREAVLTAQQAGE